MAILDRISAARDDTFTARISMLLMAASVAIASEDGATANHTNRLHFAQLHFKAAINCKALAAAIIASNATIQGEIDASPSLLGSNVPDGDLEFVLNTLIDSFANAYAVA